MARVKGILQVTGSMKGVSMYTLRGSEEVIMRTKGGPSKNTIKTRESCKGLRDSGKEWGGCTKAASSLRLAMEPLSRLANYNFMGGLNALCKKIQCMDDVHEKGQRSVMIRENRQQLTDFNFNKTNLFDSVIRLRPEWKIDREAVKATVTIPGFNPAEQLAAPNKLPFMRFVIVLGVCSNASFDEHSKSFKLDEDLLKGYRHEEHTDWFPVKRSLPAQTLETRIEGIASNLTESNTLVLGIGVEFGTVGADGEGEAVKYAGCAKIVGSV